MDLVSVGGFLGWIIKQSKQGGDGMVSNRTLLYWKFNEPKGIAGFSTKEDPQKPCWEMASEVGDFRSEFNICEDCIVFLLENGTTILSEKEIRSIIHREVSCKFFNA